MDVTAVARALHAAGGEDPVGHVLARLVARRVELAGALGGQALQVELVVVNLGAPGQRHLLVFAPDGVALRLRPSGVLAAEFRPHLTVRGSGEEVVALVLGEIDVAHAAYRGLLVLHAAPHELAPRYPRLMRVLARDLFDMSH
jgi:hypothetical protein